MFPFNTPSLTTALPPTPWFTLSKHNLQWSEDNGPAPPDASSEDSRNYNERSKAMSLYKLPLPPRCTDFRMGVAPHYMSTGCFAL